MMENEKDEQLSATEASDADAVETEIAEDDSTVDVKSESAELCENDQPVKKDSSPS